MAGLLDLLFGAPPPKQPAYSWMQPEDPNAGMLSSNNGQMLGYLAGVLQPGLTQERMARGFAGMLSGQQNDIMNQARLDALQGQREQKGAAAGVADQYVQQKKLSPADARFFITTPKASEEYSKGLINPTLTVTPDGSILIQKPFGQLSSPGGVPISEKTETVNPDGSKSPAFAIKPSLTNPSGGIVMPTMPGPRGAPQLNSGVPQINDPTMTVSPSQVARVNQPISEMSPQTREEQTKTGQGLGDEYSTIQKDAASGTRAISSLQRMKQLNLDPKLPEGALAPAFQKARSALTSLGVPVNTIKAGEEFSALHNRMILDMQPNGSLGTGFSNADRDYMDALAPDVNNTKAGREALIDGAMKVQQRKQEIAKQAYLYKKQNGTLDGFQVALSDWAEKNPLFPAPSLEARFNASGAANKATAPGQTGWSITPVK